VESFPESARNVNQNRSWTFFLATGDCAAIPQMGQTLLLSFPAFVTHRGIEWGNMSAAGSVLIVPLTVLFYSIERFRIRSLSFGAIAGKFSNLTPL
jgi:multiple sugar transport system permease protein